MRAGRAVKAWLCRTQRDRRRLGARLFGVLALGVVATVFTLALVTQGHSVTTTATGPTAPSPTAPATSRTAGQGSSTTAAAPSSTTPATDPQIAAAIGRLDKLAHASCPVPSLVPSVRLTVIPLGWRLTLYRGETKAAEKIIQPNDLEAWKGFVPPATSGIDWTPIRDLSAQSLASNTPWGFGIREALRQIPQQPAPSAALNTDVFMAMGFWDSVNAVRLCPNDVQGRDRLLWDAATALGPAAPRQTTSRPGPALPGATTSQWVATPPAPWMFSSFTDLSRLYKQPGMQSKPRTGLVFYTETGHHVGQFKVMLTPDGRSIWPCTYKYRNPATGQTYNLAIPRRWTNGQPTGFNCAMEAPSTSTKK